MERERKWEKIQKKKAKILPQQMSSSSSSSSSSLRGMGGHQQQRLLSPKTATLPWDDVLEYDVDAVLALAEECNVKKDDVYWTMMFPKQNPIDDLAKSVVSCDIRADPNASDAENVVLMTHLAKVLQVAFERAVTRLKTTTTTRDDACDYAGEGDCDVDDRDDESGNERVFDDRKDWLERENKELKEKLDKQRKEFRSLSEEMREVEIEFSKRIEMLDEERNRLPDTPKMFQFAANEDDEDTENNACEEHFFSTPRKEKRAIMNAKKQEEDLCEKQKQEEALRRANDRALALETQSDALSDNLEQSRREIRKLQKMLAKEREKNEEMERRQMVLNERLLMQTSSTTSLDAAASPSSPAKKGNAYRLGSKSRMPPLHTVEKTKRILGYEDDQNEKEIALSREETLNRWDARAQFKIAMDQLRRDLSVKSAQHDACSAKCEAQSRVLSKTVKERDELKDETKRLQRSLEKSKRIEEETIEHIRRNAEEKEERDKRLMREAVSSLRQKVRQLERERDDCRENLSETTQSLEKMKQKASKAMEKNTRLQKETTDLKFQIEKLQDQLQRTVDLYEHETLKIELGRATERAKKLQLAVDKEQKSNAEKIESLELDIEKYEKQVELLQREKLDLSSHLAVRDKELESSKSETKRVQEELETVKSSVQTKEEGFLAAERQQQLETLEVAEMLLKYERENKALKRELASLDPKFFEEVFEVKERCKKRGLVLKRYETKLKSYCETLGFAFKREAWD